MENNTTKICTECGGNMHLKKIFSVFNVNGTRISIDNMDAYVCEKCDEEVYTSEAAKRIEQIIAAARK